MTTKLKQKHPSSSLRTRITDRLRLAKSFDIPVRLTEGQAIKVVNGLHSLEPDYGYAFHFKGQLPYRFKITCFYKGRGGIYDTAIMVAEIKSEANMQLNRITGKVYPCFGFATVGVMLSLLLFVAVPVEYILVPICFSAITAFITIMAFLSRNHLITDLYRELKAFEAEQDAKIPLTLREKVWGFIQSLYKKDAPIDACRK
jgi:hypothetical protein